MKATIKNTCPSQRNDPKLNCFCYAFSTNVAEFLDKAVPPVPKIWP